MIRALAPWALLAATALIGAMGASQAQQMVRFDLQKARAGDREAQYQVALVYLSGSPPQVPQDIPEGRKWLTEAAAYGHREAQFTLGMLYFNGKLFEKDEAMAAKWLKMAADQGHADAQRNYAALLTIGTGVPRDPDAALRYMKMAYDQGQKNALVEYPALQRRAEVLARRPSPPPPPRVQPQPSAPDPLAQLLGQVTRQVIAGRQATPPQPTSPTAPARGSTVRTGKRCSIFRGNGQLCAESTIGTNSAYRQYTEVTYQNHCPWTIHVRLQCRNGRCGIGASDNSRLAAMPPNGRGSSNCETKVCGGFSNATHECYD